MKSKFLRQYLPASLFALLALYVALRATHTLGVFNMPTDSMLPNIQPNTLVFTWKGLDINRLDVIAFYDTSMALPGMRPPVRSTFLGRVVAMGGDSLKISEGRVFVNGQNADKDLPLNFIWKVSEKDFQQNAGLFDGITPVSRMAGALLVSLESARATQIKQILPLTMMDAPMTDLGYDLPWGPEARNWTNLNFGPVRVPDDCLFILGDNRNNSEDSRHRGFVPQKDVFGKRIY